MTGIQLVQVLEGIVGNALGSGQVPYPQSMPAWLRAMKEDVLFMARNIEDDFVLDIFADLDETEETVQAAATYVLGFMARSTDGAAQVVQLWDVAAPVPGTTPTGQHGTLQLPIGGAAAPAVGGVVWFPYQFFGTTCLISSTDHADYATGPDANSVRGYVVRRDE
jgi:hypothetical protein